VNVLLLGQPQDCVHALVEQLLHSLPPGHGGLSTTRASSRSIEPPVPSCHFIACDDTSQTHLWNSLDSSDLVLVLAAASPVTVDWRRVMLSCGQGFQVIHASEHSLLQELQWAVGHHVQRQTGQSPWPLRSEIPARWQGVCETCSDPECEHRLFRRLVNTRMACGPASAQCTEEVPGDEGNAVNKPAASTAS
jgi:hypothetical protein